MEIEEIQESVDKITQLVVAILCISVAGGILTIAAIACLDLKCHHLCRNSHFNT